MISIRAAGLLLVHEKEKDVKALLSSKYSVFSKDFLLRGQKLRPDSLSAQRMDTIFDGRGSLLRTNDGLQQYVQKDTVHSVILDTLK